MPRKSSQLRAQSQPRRGLRREEAAIYVGLSPSMFDLMVKCGELPTPKKFGTASVWDMHQLDTTFDGPASDTGGDGPGGASSGNANPWDK